MAGALEPAREVPSEVLSSQDALVESGEISYKRSYLGTLA